MGATRYNRHRMSSDMAAYTRLMAQDNGAQLHRLCQQLARAMGEEVTQRQRQVLTLYYDQGLTMEQIGRELGVDRRPSPGPSSGERPACAAACAMAAPACCGRACPASGKKIFAGPLTSGAPGEDNTENKKGR